MTPCLRRRGFTLIELMMVLVVVAAALAGSLYAMVLSLVAIALAARADWGRKPADKPLGKP